MIGDRSFNAKGVGRGPGEGNKPAVRRGAIPAAAVYTCLFFGFLGMALAYCVSQILLFPMARFSGPHACSQRLREVQYALQSYHEEHGVFPPAYTVDANGRPMHSWRTLILPYFHFPTPYDKIDLTKPWDDPVNREACETSMPIYRCPNADCPDHHATYFAIVTPNSFLRGMKTSAFKRMKDDPSQTLMLIEVNQDQSVPWMAPVDADEAMLESMAFADGGPHDPDRLAAYCRGGMVRMTPEGQRKFLPGLISINGGEKFPEELRFTHY